MLAALVTASTSLINLHSTTREFEPIPVKFERSQKSEGIDELQLKSNVYNVWYETVMEPRTFWKYDCDTDVGDGANGNWHDYWAVRKAEKPAALADSVRGIGLYSAKKIVDSNSYFLRKPRSWNAFQEEIRDISRDRSLALPDIYYEVIITYGKENAENLGYANSTNCEWKQVTEMVEVVQKKRDFLKTLTSSISIRFEDGLLLSTEKETFEASFDGIDTSVRAVRTVNEYQIRAEQGSNQYVLKALRRLAVRPEAQQIRASLIKENGTLTLKISDKLSDELKRLYSDSALQLNYIVTRKAFVDNNEAKGSLVVQNGAAEIDLKTDPIWEKASLFGSAKKTLQPGKTYYVKIKIKRLNTDAFNSSESDEIRTTEITF
jgi:hypothetical protein